MTITQAIIQSVVEGLTEFLPISSTAHMKFVNPMIGVDPNDDFAKLFDIVIQLPAILAVVVLYWRKFFDFSRWNFYIKLIVAVIPAIVFGALLQKYIDRALDNLYFIAWVMVAGGIIFLFVDKWFKRPVIDDEREVTNGIAFKIGCFQVLSILFPGCSRSAATIVGGMTQKLTRKAAAEFSFFLAVPTMLAATAKKLWDAHKEHPDLLNRQHATTLALSSIVTFMVAILVIRFFIEFIKKYGFKPWGVYRIVAGAVMLFLLWRGML